MFVDCDHDSVNCDTLSTSGFVRDVIFLPNGPSGGSSLPQQHRCNVVHGLTYLLLDTGCVAKTRRVLAARGAGVECVLLLQVYRLMSVSACAVVVCAMASGLEAFSSPRSGAFEYYVQVCRFWCILTDS